MGGTGGCSQGSLPGESDISHQEEGHARRESPSAGGPYKIQGVKKFGAKIRERRPQGFWTLS